MQNKTFRLFISSTFSDFQNERELLQVKVFPEIEKYCEDIGYQFQPIDLRWGINNEAQLDQKTIEICLEEVKACKHFPYPNFLIMLGNRYGWIPLPYMIDQDEFEQILNNANNDECNLLTNWYKLDLNQLPSSYIIKERTAEFEDYNVWDKEENKLRDILQTIVNTLKFSQLKKDKYFTSATEQEAHYGICNYRSDINNTCKEKSDVDNNYVLAYIREKEQDDNVKLTTFKDELKSLLPPENIIKTLDEDKFVDSIIGNLKIKIDNQYKLFKDITEEEKEFQEHKQFKDERLKVFVGQQDILCNIQDYINTTSNAPLIIYGKSGMGKSSLMAKAIDQTKEKNIIYRFVGASDKSSDLRHLLISICDKITNSPVSSIKYEFEEYKFFNQIKEIFESSKDEIVIFIDALDQLNKKQSLSWLPSKLPSNLKIIISTLNDDKYAEDSIYYYNLIKNYKDINFIEIVSLKENNAKDIILELLKIENRTLQKNQLDFVVEKFNQVNTPLYLKVIIENIKELESFEDISLLHLASDTEEQIKIFIDELTNIYHHPKILVQRVFGYILASKDGLSEKEIISILSLDSEVMEALENNFHTNKISQIPLSVWTRLHYDIKAFLNVRNIDNTSLYVFFHREFKNVVKKYFYNEDKELLHKYILTYFNLL